MRQLYYTVQILLRGRGSNFIKLVSLTLGLLIGILLFSQIAYELSYENFYKDPENVALLRCRRVKDGISDKDYDDSTFRPAAADLWEALPDLIESASLSVNFYQPDCYIDDKKLEDMQVMFADTLFSRPSAWKYYVATHTNWLHLCLSFSHRVKHADFLVTRSRLERLSP